MNIRLRGAILLVLFFIVCMGTSFYISRYKLVVYPIDGASMEPNVFHKDKVLVYRTQKVKYGDVIIFFSEAYNKRLIKRVIGLGGDVIDIKYNEELEAFQIWRNNKLLKEDYIKEKMMPPYYSEKQLIVPEGKMFFLGDNRNWSLDSHVEDVMEDLSLIEGKVLMRYKGYDIGFLFNSGTIKNQLYI